MKIRPLNDVVFVQKSDKPKYKGNILLVEGTSDEGIVVAVPEKHKADLKEGDKVKFNADDMAEQTIDGTQYLMIRFDKLICILS